MSAPTVNPATPPQQERRSGLAKWIRRLAIPIIIGWVLLVAVLNTAVPQLEVVGQMRSVSMSPSEAPSVIAMKRVGEVFEEFKSDSSAMIVLEGDQPLGADAHRYYDELVDRLEADTKHVEHVQDFWGDPLTEAGAQSSDGKATYVQVFLAGNMGEALSNESVLQVKTIVDGLPPPPGIKVFVTGGSALVADQQIASDRSIQIIEMVTFGVIITMLLLVYRSIRTVLLVLVMVFLTLSATRGVVAFLGYHELIGLSTFATNLLVTLAIAAATDYAIFLDRALPGSPHDRRGPRIRLLHDVSRHRARGAGLGHDDRGRDVLPFVHPAARTSSRWVFRWRSEWPPGCSSR